MPLALESSLLLVAMLSQTVAGNLPVSGELANDSHADDNDDGQQLSLNRDTTEKQ